MSADPHSAIQQHAKAAWLQQLDRIEGRLQAIPEGRYYVTTPMHISVETAERLRHEFEKHFPGQSFVVLGGGIQVHPMPSPGQLDRIEQKLDALIKALAEDEEPEVERSLETGLPVARRRDETRGL